jgi:hypothetical protein
MTGAGTTTLTGTVNLGLAGVTSQPVVNGGRVLNLNSGATFQGNGLFLAGGTINVAAGQTFASIGERTATNTVLSDNTINNGIFNTPASSCKTRARASWAATRALLQPPAVPSNDEGR